jgi:hypothetical protein
MWLNIIFFNVRFSTQTFMKWQFCFREHILVYSALMSEKYLLWYKLYFNVTYEHYITTASQALFPKPPWLTAPNPNVLLFFYKLNWSRFHYKFLGLTGIAYSSVYDVSETFKVPSSVWSQEQLKWLDSGLGTSQRSLSIGFVLYNTTSFPCYKVYLKHHAPGDIDSWSVH